jgi:ADP-heptose:LPS heptosyltransferase
MKLKATVSLTYKLIFSYLLKRNISRPEISNVKSNRVLFIPYDSLGDMAMTVPIFNAIMKAHPNWQLDVLCTPRSFSIIENHPAIKKFYKLDINVSFLKEDDKYKYQIQQLYKENFDLLIYLGERISSASLWRISKIKALQRLSLPFLDSEIHKKGINPLGIGLFDRYIGKSKEKEKHFCLRMLSILDDLPISPSTIIDLSLHMPQIALPKSILPLEGHKILFNPTGSQIGNTLSSKQISEIIEQLSDLSFILCLFDTDDNQKLIPDNLKLIWLPCKDIIMASSWLECMDLILTTDTSIGHIAASKNLSTIVMRSNESWRDCCNPLSSSVTMLQGKNDDIKALSTKDIVKSVLEHFNLESLS